MKHTRIALIASLLSAPQISMADDSGMAGLDLPGELSGTLTLTTDYTFRGITQSDENPAVQGSVDWSNDLGKGFGVYLGTWASNVDFNDGSESSTEFDFYGGITYELEKWSFDVGVIHYTYPGASNNLNYNFTEGMAAIGYDFDVVSLQGSVNFTSENFGDTGDAQYYKLAADAPLPYEFSLSAHIGHQSIEDNANFGVPDYADWSVGLGYTIENFDLSLQYIDTDLDKTECADGCSASLVFSVGRSF